MSPSYATLPLTSISIADCIMRLQVNEQMMAFESRPIESVTQARS